MNIEVDVYNKLTSLNIPVYPVKIKQNTTFPCAVYFVVAEVSKDADNKNEIVYKSYRMQVDIYSKSYKEAKNLKDKAIDLLLELNATEISAVDMYEDEEMLYREMIDFKINKGE